MENTNNNKTLKRKKKSPFNTSPQKSALRYIYTNIGSDYIEIFPLAIAVLLKAPRKKLVSEAVARWRSWQRRMINGRHCQNGNYRLTSSGRPSPRPLTPPSSWVRGRLGREGEKEREKMKRKRERESDNSRGNAASSNELDSSLNRFKARDRFGTHFRSTSYSFY